MIILRGTASFLIDRYAIYESNMKYQFTKKQYYIIVTNFMLLTVLITIGYLYFVKEQDDVTEQDECNALSGKTGMQAPTENYWKCLDNKSCTVNIIGGGGNPELLDSDWVKYECVSKPQVSFIPKCNGFNESFNFLYNISSSATNTVHITNRQNSDSIPTTIIGGALRFYDTPYHENEMEYILKSTTVNEAVFEYIAKSNIKSPEGEIMECSGLITINL